MIWSQRSKYDKNDCPDLTPPQIASFYHDVGGNYDALFLEQSPESIAFIYKSLGCLHSLQPDTADDDACYSPSIPALKPQGFVTWQTIQILLGPQEHVSYVQNALKAYDVVDPLSNKRFPKTLPRSCFPSQPDTAMVKWHATVTERLRSQADDAAHNAEQLNTRQHSRPTSAVDGSAPPDDRVGALRSFSEPHHHHEHEERPKIVRSFSKAAPPKLKEGANAVALTFRNIANPHLWSGHSPSHEHSSSTSRTRRRSRDGRADDVSENDPSNIPPIHSHHHTSRPNTHHGAVTPSRRRSPKLSSRNVERRALWYIGDFSDDTSGKSPDNDKSLSPHRPRPRRHHSHDPPVSEYFGRRDWDSDRPSSQYLNDMGQGAPSHHRRKSDEHGRAATGSSHGRERAQTTLSDGPRIHKGRSPERHTVHGLHPHRASIPHYRPSQGYVQSAGGYEGQSPGKSPNGSRSYAAFRDPWATDEHAKKEFDHQSSRPATSGQYGGSVYSASAPSAAMSSSGSSPSEVGSGVRSSTHRYVTPVNGVKGRQYPSEPAWRYQSGSSRESVR